MSDHIIITKATKGFIVTRGPDTFAFHTLLDVAKELVSFLKFDTSSKITITVTAERK